MANADIEGVGDRVEVHGEDARRLSFPDGSFDVVLSTLCLHNIEDGRDRAVREIARVLARGGTAVVSDLAATAEVATLLRAAGFRVTVSGLVWKTFPFQRVVGARKAE